MHHFIIFLSITIVNQWWIYMDKFWTVKRTITCEVNNCA